ncbi:uncharacterized protein LOC122659757 isoform X3 [Telopea speciosissima]|uniref:uncharacterized protein LOC122659757 isoform X3 n=1 Tax=Telopea speciosissima TaxID=54955 RepID=UPI001CC7C272|nr:uncharacterized protein LOC122659757 isoform X3 [Telopea speciosissima]
MLSLPLLNPFFPLSSSSSSSTAVDFPVAAACRKSKHLKPSSLFLVRQLKARVLHGQDASTEDENLEGQEFRVLTAVRSDYNEIVIVDTPKSRILLLDSTQNIHSMSNRGEKWTGAYWDEFASLPAIVPQGPIGILGLGGGTVAHLMLDLWPSLKLEGWEIDRIVSTWLEMSSRLMPHGRIMVNCGGNHVETSIIRDGITFPELSANDGAWVQNSTITALCKAFPGNLSWKRMAKADGENYLALTGPLPDLNAWSAIVPDYLSSSVKQWRPCGPVA